MSPERFRFVYSGINLRANFTFAQKLPEINHILIGYQGDPGLAPYIIHAFHYLFIFQPPGNGRPKRFFLIFMGQIEKFDQRLQF